LNVLDASSSSPANNTRNKRKFKESGSQRGSVDSSLEIGEEDVNFDETAVIRESVPVAVDKKRKRLKADTVPRALMVSKNGVVIF
jgi:hypothetical protein